MLLIALIGHMLFVYYATCIIIRYVTSSWGGAMLLYKSVGSASWLSSVQLYQFTLGYQDIDLGAGCGELLSVGHSGGSD